jgi:hypothetical protein
VPGNLEALLDRRHLEHNGEMRPEFFSWRYNIAEMSSYPPCARGHQLKGLITEDCQYGRAGLFAKIALDHVPRNPVLSPAIPPMGSSCTSIVKNGRLQKNYFTFAF